MNENHPRDGLDYKTGRVN